MTHYIKDWLSGTHNKVTKMNLPLRAISQTFAGADICQFSVHNLYCLIFVYQLFSRMTTSRKVPSTHFFKMNITWDLNFFIFFSKLWFMSDLLCVCNLRVLRGVWKTVVTAFSFDIMLQQFSIHPLLKPLK